MNRTAQTSHTRYVVSGMRRSDGRPPPTDLEVADWREAVDASCASWPDEDLYHVFRVVYNAAPSG